MLDECVTCVPYMDNEEGIKKKIFRYPWRKGKVFEGSLDQSRIWVWVWVWMSCGIVLG